MHQPEAPDISAGMDEDIYQQFAVDARISYPSYMAMDAFIDVERLRTLDGYIARVSSGASTLLRVTMSPSSAARISWKPMPSRYRVRR